MITLITRKLSDPMFGTQAERSIMESIERELFHLANTLSVTIVNQEVGGGYYRIWLEGEEAGEAAMTAVRMANADNEVLITESEDEAYR